MDHGNFRLGNGQRVTRSVRKKEKSFYENTKKQQILDSKKVFKIKCIKNK